MANIDKLNFTFTDNQTTIMAAHLNAIVGAINDLIDAVEETPATTIDITDAILATTWEAGGIKHADGGIQSAQSFDHSGYYDISTYAGKVLNYSRIVRDSSTSSPIGLAFYDSSQQYISGQGLHHSAAENGWEDYDCNIPATAKYVRMSWYNSTGSGSEWANDFYAKIKD